MANAKFAILRLPTELRAKIFELLVEARRWHVVKSQGSGEVCLQECYARESKATADVTEQCLGEQCGEQAKVPGNKGPPLTNTALLLACRQFYKDAVNSVELLEQDHIFQVNLQSRDTLTAFVAKLTQRQRKAIRTLHVQFPDYNADECYPTAEENPLYMISELTGLRYLHVSLRGELRQMCRVDLRGRTGLQLMPLRSLDLDLVNVRIITTTIPPAGVPILARMPSLDMDYSDLWRKSTALPLRHMEEVPQSL